MVIIIIMVKVIANMNDFVSCNDDYSADGDNGYGD